ncbi:GtrA family protein [Isoptericola chiayiensis]|uniref:GtrA family protein n=1 Tax=Isoptericola chiayiensis TaxID=579446 RepID=A0ABP8Y4J3_9MICO|nr:GtrA family protein [Isoptericola chiayiensis]NOV99346.1 putative flippase GtrA [Isoptericola chiayiensis]
MSRAPAPAAPRPRAWPVRFVAATWRRRVELLRFGTVGGLAYVVNLAVFNLLLHGPAPFDVLSHKPVTVNVVAVAVSTVVAWLGNRYWTFSAGRTTRHVRELIEFGLVNVGGLVISSACLAVSRYVLGFDSILADNVAANGVGLVLGMIFRYVMYRGVVFRGDR